MTWELADETWTDAPPAAVTAAPDVPPAAITTAPDVPPAATTTAPHTPPAATTAETEIETDNRFANINMSAQEFIQLNENDSTKKKTLGHQKLFETFLQTKQEPRQIHHIPAAELNSYLCEFILRVRQKDGTDYEPTSLRSIISSLDRYLKRHNYNISIVRGTEFRQAMDVLANKGKELKKKGLGNKPHASDAINDRTIEKLYEAGQLGTTTPTSMIQTLWLNNCLHFGMRCGGTEHRHVSLLSLHKKFLVSFVMLAYAGHEL